MVVPVIEHVVTSGITRGGKTKASAKLNLPRMMLRDPLRPGFIIVDAAGSLTDELGVHLVRRGIEFLYDDARSTRDTLGYPFFEPSTHSDSGQREAENRERIAEAIAVLIRSRGLLQVEGNPIIREGLYDAFHLLIHQSEALPFSALRNCFASETDDHHYLIDHCTHPVYRMRFIHYGLLRGQQREYKCAPAERVLRAVCDSPQFRARCMPTFDLAGFLNGGGTLLVNAQSRGNLSRPDASLICGQIILTVIRLARIGRFTRRVVLIADEGKTAGLVDQNLTRALAEAAKWNLEIQVIIQNPLFADLSITEDLFGNCNTRFFFKHIDPKAARFVAEMIGVPTLDPLLIRKTEWHTRQVHDGHSLEEVISRGSWESDDGRKGESTNRNIVARPRYVLAHDRHDTLYSLEDQIRLKQRDVMNLGVGSCFIMQGNSVTTEPQYIPLLEAPWPGLMFSRNPTLTLAEEKLRLWLERLRQTHPAYRGSSELWAVPPTYRPTRSRGSRGARRSLNG